MPTASKKSAPQRPIDEFRFDFAVPDSGKRYKLYDEIGRGGVANVFIGIDKDLNRQVAVKVLKRSPKPTRESILRFMGEAQITAKLQHPGIVPIYDMGVLNTNSLYFAMEKVEGKTLRQILRERDNGDKTHTRQRLLRIFEQVCQIVAYAHSRHVVHRDLKPENIMVGEFGKVYVMDWGIAKDLDDEVCADPTGPSPALDDLLDNDTQNLTIPGQVKGTPGYMSPEQALGISRHVGYRSDVFSLGIILYEILVGKHPFIAASVRDTLRAIAKSSSAQLARNLKPHREFGSICTKALQKQLDDRYPDVGAMEEEVRRALEHLPITVHRDSLPGHFIKFAKRHQTLSVVFVTFCVVSTMVILLKLHQDREVQSLLGNAGKRVSVVEEHQQHLELLDAQLSNCPAEMREELLQNIREMRTRKLTNSNTARALLTLAINKQGNELPAETIETWKRLWLNDIKTNILLGDTNAARSVEEEMNSLRKDRQGLLAWTEEDRKRLRKYQVILHPR